MKKIILVCSILLFAAGGVIMSCFDDAGSGSYACYGYSGISDHCWTANALSKEDCLNQGCIFSSGTCPDNGYTQDCGDYWIHSYESCW